MKTPFRFALFAVVAAGVALAAAPARVILHDTLEHFRGGLKLGTNGTTATHSASGRIDFTFAALPDDGGTTGSACAYTTWGATCPSDGTAGTCTGATVGDTCIVGVGYGASGVPVAGEDDHFDCIVTATNTVKVRRCGVRGRAALVDAGYVVRTFR
jgi:hypothetical protein